MKQRKQEIDYITPQTSGSASLLVSLGYTYEVIKRHEDKADDLLMVFLDGKHIPFKSNRGNLPYVRRKNIYAFAKHRHKSLRMAPLERKILYCID